MLQALAGWMTLTGKPGVLPPKAVCPSWTSPAACTPAWRCLRPCTKAHRNGIGTDCDISLFEAALAMLSYVGTWHLTGGFTGQNDALRSPLAGAIPGLPDLGFLDRGGGTQGEVLPPVDNDA